MSTGSEQRRFWSEHPASLQGLLAHLQEALHDAGQVTQGQQLLLPTTPRSVCQELGLNWWAAVKLYEDGWLSFSPEETVQLDEAQEAELLFVGSLVVAGCDRRMLVSLLSGLSKPYAYDLRRIYYDWAARDWRIFPDPNAHPEAMFAEWLEMLVKRRDTNALQGIIELTHDALSRVRHEAETSTPPAPASSLD